MGTINWLNSQLENDLHRTKKSMIELKVILEGTGGMSTVNPGHKEILKKKLENYDEDIIKGNLSKESIHRYILDTNDLITDILNQDKNVFKQYLLKALNRDENRLDEVLWAIEKNHLENLLTKNEIMFLLDKTDNDQLFRILKKVNKQIIFDYRYSNDEKKNITKKLYNIIDKNLIEKEIKKLNDNVHGTDHIMNRIIEMEWNSDYAKELINKGLINLNRSIFDYNVDAIKLLNEQERLNRFKQYLDINNVICYLLYSDNKNSLLNLVWTENEILNNDSIKELFNHLTKGKNLNSVFLSKIPGSVLEKLWVKEKVLN